MLTSDCKPQLSSLQAISEPELGHAGPAYTASTVSAVVPPQSEMSTPCVAGAVQRNHTSACAVGQAPDCCGLSVAPVVTTEKLPRPEIGVALAQLLAPC